MPDPNFDDLINMPVEDAEPPLSIPVGTWSVLVKKYEEVKSTQKGTPGVKFTFQLLEPGPDVDAGQLMDFRERYPDYKKKEVAETFWITRDAMHRLRGFVEKIGVDITGKTFKQIFPETIGRSVNAYMTAVPSQRPGDATVYTNISAFSEAI